MTRDHDPEAWRRAARSGWTWTGTQRPAFAVPPGPGQESVWDYPRPPRLVPDPREVLVRFRDTEIARTSTAIRLLETSHAPTFYIPRADVVTALLRPSGTRSICEWKGTCTYYDVVVGEHAFTDAAWSYVRPDRDAASIAGHVAFYAGPLECYVGGERARSQAGGFYGGWITSELVGPFKGDPSTRGW